MIRDSCFQTMDGKSVTVHGFPMKMLHPQFHWGFWGWAYRCLTQISMVTADFYVNHTPSALHGNTFYPCVVLRSGSGSSTNAFTLLRSYEEKVWGVPQFCLCSMNIEIATNANNENHIQQINCTPFFMQFINESYEELMLRYFEETIDRLDKGISIRSKNIDIPLHDNEEFMFDNSEMSILFRYPSSYFSSELVPIINDWKSFFLTVKNDIGVLSQLPPVIYHTGSVAELYNKIIAKTRDNDV